MLEVVNKFLNQIFGNKSDKDIKEMTPYVEKINAFFNSYSSLSNDQLRGKTAELKARIHEAIKEDQERVNELKAKVELDETSFNEKELIYEEIDKIDKEIVEKIEAQLKEILPEAFAVVKETARRFKENDELEVNATEMDLELAVNAGHITIVGDNAKWKNRTWEGGWK